jgi:acetolactate decarboxylase
MFLNKKVSLSAVAVLLLLVSMAACNGDATSQKYALNPIVQRETLFQISTVDALINGIYDGVTTIGELKNYGDFGIGTFEALDGEMAVIDGEVYQIKADGVAYPVADSMETPFAAVTFFDIDLEETVPSGINYQQLQVFLDGILPTGNIFYAIKIEGTFSYMKTRSVPAQVKPYPKLVEVTENQSIFEFYNIGGTIVGFYCPSYVNGINVSGYHLHFLTEDKNAGGHILDFTVKNASVQVDYTS